jgi:hypothetical protein
LIYKAGSCTEWKNKNVSICTPLQDMNYWLCAMTQRARSWVLFRFLLTIISYFHISRREKEMVCSTHWSRMGRIYETGRFDPTVDIDPTLQVSVLSRRKRALETRFSNIPDSSLNLTQMSRRKYCDGMIHC